MTELWKWIDGKKTYITAILIGVFSGLNAMGVEIPEWVYVALASIFGISLRHGISKTAKCWLLLAVLFIAGCGSEVKMTPKYSRLLDGNVQWAYGISELANEPNQCDTCIGGWTREQMREVLGLNAQLWQDFQDARDLRVREDN